MEGICRQKASHSTWRTWEKFRNRANPLRTIFFNDRGLRAGWRLAIFVGIFVGLGYLVGWIDSKIPAISALQKRPFLDPVNTAESELEALLQVLIATWIMSR